MNEIKNEVKFSRKRQIEDSKFTFDEIKVPHNISNYLYQFEKFINHQKNLPEKSDENNIDELKNRLLSLEQNFSTLTFIASDLLKRVYELENSKKITTPVYNVPISMFKVEIDGDEKYIHEVEPDILKLAIISKQEVMKRENNGEFKLLENFLDSYGNNYYINLHSPGLFAKKVVDLLLPKECIINYKIPLSGGRQIGRPSLPKKCVMFIEYAMKYLGGSIVYDYEIYKIKAFQKVNSRSIDMKKPYSKNGIFFNGDKTFFTLEDVEKLTTLL